MVRGSLGLRALTTRHAASRKPHEFSGTAPVGRTRQTSDGYFVARVFAPCAPACSSLQAKGAGKSKMQAVKVPKDASRNARAARALQGNSKSPRQIPAL
jgi:hypothetical protein